MATLPVPASIDSEKAVLGAMIASRNFLIEAIDTLSPTDFYDQKQNAVIFKALISLYKKNIEVDNVALVNELNAMKALDKIGGIDYLLNISDISLSSSDASYHLKIVRDYSIIRTLFKTTDDLKEAYFNKPTTSDIGDFLEEYTNKVVSITRNRATGDFVDLSDVVTNLNRKIEAKYRQRDKNDVTGLDTGYKILNSLINGWQNGSIYILAARPSVGKTALALNFLWQVAYLTKKTVVLFSVEMNAEQIVERILSSVSSVSSRKFRKGNVTDSDLIALSEAETRINTTKILIDDTSGIKVGDIRTKLSKLKSRDPNLGFVVIDYLGLVRLNNPLPSNKDNIDEIMRTLKSIARDLDLPILVLSQLSRDNEKGKRQPMLSDLRDSGSIEQDADVVMLLHRDAYQKTNQVDQNTIEANDANDFSNNDTIHVNVAKNRQGPTGEFLLSFLMNISKFVELTTNSFKQGE